MSIYGVKWDGISNSKMVRTDAAANFTDPVPYCYGMTSSSCTSPFDTISPWKDMIVEEINGNSMVKIPKFWYKIEDLAPGLSIKISNTELDGYNISPAHMDRDDFIGERDYVWIGKYICDSECKSISGSSPLANLSRSEFRSKIKELNSGFLPQDLTIYWTIRLLYLVEFANWNVQDCLGHGFDNGSIIPNTGKTDTMPYHTGTMALGRKLRDVVQYRNIEGLYDLVAEFVDGIRFDGRKIYIILNPDKFSDTENGDYIGDREDISGCIAGYKIPTLDKYQWALFPSTVFDTKNYADYICDYTCYLHSGDPDGSNNPTDTGKVMYVGPLFNQLKTSGMFMQVTGVSEYGKSDRIGNRIMLLNNTFK